MATLEKIRSKSVLLVSVIFVALFLFIITIIDNPMQVFQDHTTVAKVKGQKVDYELYSQRATELREQNPDMDDAQALQSLIWEALVNNEFDHLGITVTDSELSNLLVGENAPAELSYAFTQQNGMSPKEFRAAMDNPTAYNLPAEAAAQMLPIWMKYEDDMASTLKIRKLGALLQGTIQANKLDALAQHNEANTTYAIAYVPRSIYSVNDSVTAEEINRTYAERRANYRLKEPTRLVRFVSLDITPSPDDRAAARAAANEAVAALQAAPSMEGLAGNSQFIVNYGSADNDALAQLRQPALTKFLQDSVIGAVGIIADNTYMSQNPQIVIAKLIDKANRSNGFTLRQFVLDPAFNQDSVIAKLNAGADAATLDGVIGEAHEIPYKYSQLPEEIVTALNEAGQGVYVPLTNGTNAFATCIVSYEEPTDIYDYAVATLNIEPSKATIDGLRSRMQAFLDTATTAATFNTEVAMNFGLMIQEDMVNANSSALGRLTDSRGLVAWAMDADEGEVSREVSDNRNTRLTAAAVVAKYPAGYTPLSNSAVYDQMQAYALDTKRANRLIDEFSGKGNTLADYAAAMGVTTPDSLQNIILSTPRFAQLGTIRGHKAGDVIGPFRWGTNVIVAEVLEANEGTAPFDEASALLNLNRTYQNLLMGNSMELLLGNDVVDNRLLKFTRQQ